MQWLRHLVIPDGVEQIANSCCARAQLRITTLGLRMKPVGGRVGRVWTGGQSVVGGGREMSGQLLMDGPLDAHQPRVL